MAKEQINYYREQPIREFDLNQTLYNTIVNVNSNNLDSHAIGFLGTNITYRSMLKNVDRLADAYSKNGIVEGDTVGICTINMPIVQENLLALSKLGATSKWIDLRIKGKDLIKNINESKCKILVIFDGITSSIEEIINETDVEQVLVVSPKDYLNPIIHLLADLKDYREGKKIILPTDKRFIKYSDYLKKGDVNSEVKPASFEKDRPSIIVQSSGSTGKPKSIIHTEYNFNSSMQKEAFTDLPLCAGKTMHISIPPFIIYGLNNSIYASLAFSMKAEMNPYVSETTVYDDLGKFDYACAAPLHYRYLYNKIVDLTIKIKELENSNSNSDKKELSKALKELSVIMKKLSNVGVFVSGGDKMSPQELLKMQHTFGKTIVNGYGNNEMTGAAIISPVYASKPDSIGIPMKGVSVACFEPETNKLLTVGEEGEICLKSDSVFKEYLGNEEETKKVKQIHENGEEWIHTGDLGYIDSDGYVYVTGRSKRLIRRAAFKIAPDTIENIILTIPEVKDCVVVGVPDDAELFVPLAYVELMEENINDFEKIKRKIEKICINELPDYENPKYIVNIDKIPYHNNKHAFTVLEKMGIEYIESLKNSEFVLKKV